MELWMACTVAKRAAWTPVTVAVTVGKSAAVDGGDGASRYQCQILPSKFSISCALALIVFGEGREAECYWCGQWRKHSSFVFTARITGPCVADKKFCCSEFQVVRIPHQMYFRRKP
jgi:hypothetical protein